jgi:hypothetical protein
MRWGGGGAITVGGVSQVTRLNKCGGTFLVNMSRHQLHTSGGRGEYWRGPTYQLVVCDRGGDLGTCVLYCVRCWSGEPAWHGLFWQWRELIGPAVHSHI